MAHRNALMQMKREAREKELRDFNQGNQPSQPDLATQFREIDSKIQPKGSENIAQLDK